jgi:hypothetical protein
MSRRRTVFEDLIIIAAKLPWQAGLALALLSLIGRNYSPDSAYS